MPLRSALMDGAGPSHDLAAGAPVAPAPAPAPPAMMATLANAVQALGRGFDVTADTRLLYCKGAPASRGRGDAGLEHGAEDGDVALAEGAGGGGGGGAVLTDVPVEVDVDVFRESRVRSRPEPTPFVCSFPKMVEYFNKKSGLSGSVPLGSFNSMFSFTGSSKNDAAVTKALALDGYFVPLFKVKLTSSELVLREDVKRAIPYSWDPSSLASFIENYGTHIITSVTIGGKDEVYIKQHHSSQLSSSEFEKYVTDIGDERFLNLENQSNTAPINYKEKDITVIFRRRGGCDLVQNHVEWTRTVPSAPDVINMTFLPIVSLVEGLPGKHYLARAIDLYLEYKPPIEELQYFLEFQVQRVWAPEPTTIPGHHRKEPVCPFLQFSLMGPKLYVSSEQICVGRKPVTGLKLSLEGSKQNRLTIHLQHLSSLPKILVPHWDSHVAIGPPKWQGPEEQDSRWFESIKWKNFAHVSTAPIENTETSIGDLSGVYVVTGAQLGVWDFGAKSVLHLKLLFSKVPGCTIRRSVWDHSPSSHSTQKVDEVSSSSSSEGSKLAKIVDMSEMSKGPSDSPGHWLVTGAKLGVEKGRIVVRVKYSLLNY
ncbi:LOW QUALITY PROTEIN: MACPF domain-containing protein CAD1-like [Ananas comosus]|uniref:LOW QUALITY PROTEIN: MACPF domain-containing protein CAD1-like n=1 Tax=Ananas comosus TaxID=4615 RepID=A0A6P5GID6_ANACO|nr:LOW QUALITY PROTEIN: MACPF domain-containing protein CAD1-like [Ananas comosus]